MNYSQLIEDSENWPIKYSFANFHVKCLKTQFSEHPWSIAECESSFLEDKIIERDCRLGLEIGTGTGVSCISAGLGFKRTRGFLYTLDPFVEEFFGRCDGYTKESKEQSLKGVGKFINEILSCLDLPVKSVIGYSPQDVHDLMEKACLPTFGQRLDYVFIDGRHETEAVKADFDAVLPFLSDKAIIFFHDIPCIQPAGIEYIEGKWGSPLVRPVEFYNPHGFNLGYLER